MKTCRMHLNLAQRLVGWGGVGVGVGVGRSLTSVG